MLHGTAHLGAYVHNTKQRQVQNGKKKRNAGETNNDRAATKLDTRVLSLFLWRSIIYTTSPLKSAYAAAAPYESAIKHFS